MYSILYILNPHRLKIFTHPTKIWLNFPQHLLVTINKPFFLVASVEVT